MNMRDAEEAYRNDPTFHSFVNHLIHELEVGTVSLYELRDACTLAMNLFYMRRPIDMIDSIKYAMRAREYLKSCQPAEDKKSRENT